MRGFSPLLRRNDSGLCTESFRTFSNSDATCCGQSATGSYGIAAVVRVNSSCTLVTFPGLENSRHPRRLGKRIILA
jgi:hypothetical protein